MYKVLRHSTIGLLFCAVLFSACHSKRKTVKTETKQPAEVKNDNRALLSLKTGIPEKDMGNKKLFHFIGDWYGAPYKFGGCEKNGVDCSCFANILYKDVYGLRLERSSRDIYKMCDKIKTGDLREGDFVFFKMNSKDITHVGVYLSNNKFVHASTSKGVMVNDLNDTYYKKYFYSAGRLKR